MRREFTITLLDDPATEAQEQFTLHLEAGDGYTISTPSMFTFTINSSDQLTVAFAQATSSAQENGSVVNVQLTVSPAPTSVVRVPYSISGSASSGTDYSITNSGTVNIARGATSANISVRITDDDAGERDETIRLTLDPPRPDAPYVLGRTSHTLTIQDGDGGLPPPPDGNTLPVLSFGRTPVIASGLSGGQYQDFADVEILFSAYPSADIPIRIRVTSEPSTSTYSVAGVTGGVFTLHSERSGVFRVSGT